MGVSRGPMREALASVSISDCRAIARSNGDGCETDPTKAFTEPTLLVRQVRADCVPIREAPPMAIANPPEGVYPEGAQKGPPRGPPGGAPPGVPGGPGVYISEGI